MDRDEDGFALLRMSIPSDPTRATTGRNATKNRDCLEPIVKDGYQRAACEFSLVVPLWSAIRGDAHRQQAFAVRPRPPVYDISVGLGLERSGAGPGRFFLRVLCREPQGRPVRMGEQPKPPQLAIAEAIH